MRWTVSHHAGHLLTGRCCWHRKAQAGSPRGHGQRRGGDGWPGAEGPELACQTTESARELLHTSETIGEGSFLLLQIWESFKGRVFFSWDAPVFTCDLCKMFQARTRSHFMPQTHFLSWWTFLAVEAGDTLGWRENRSGDSSEHAVAYPGGHGHSTCLGWVSKHFAVTILTPSKLPSPSWRRGVIVAALWPNAPWLWLKETWRNP